MTDATGRLVVDSRLRRTQARLEQELATRSRDLDEHPDMPGARFASRFIQYLDLLDGYGRNKELAAEFRKVALGMRASS